MKAMTYGWKLREKSSKQSFVFVKRALTVVTCCCFFHWKPAVPEKDSDVSYFPQLTHFNPTYFTLMSSIYTLNEEFITSAGKDIYSSTVLKYSFEVLLLYIKGWFQAYFDTSE